MTTASAAAQAGSLSVWDLIFYIWLAGVVLFAIEEGWRRLVRAQRRGIEDRHRRRVELALAKAGQPYDPVRNGPRLTASQDAYLGLKLSEKILPAAVIPSSPGARPVGDVLGPCRHERIVPVITGEGELVRWVCANYRRCGARYPSGIAIYEDGG